MGCVCMFEEHIGDLVSVGHKRPNGVFFIDGTIISVNPTHLLLKTKYGNQALLLSDISKVEFHAQPTAPGGRI